MPKSFHVKATIEDTVDHLETAEEAENYFVAKLQAQGLHEPVICKAEELK